MDNTLQSVKKILQDYNYLHYNAISELIKKDGVFESGVKNPEDIVNGLILGDIKTHGMNSAFIQVGLGYYALRKSSDEENLFSYLSCRLRNFAFWQIDKHDTEYSFQIFGKDMFKTESFFSLLDNLKINGKIASYDPITHEQIVVGLSQISS